MILAISGGDVLAFVGATLALAITLGGVLAVVFTYLKKTTKDIVREDRDDLQKRLHTVEEAEKQCNERLVSLESTTQHMADMLSGAAAVAELATTVAFNHDEILRRLDALNARLARLRKPA